MLIPLISLINFSKYLLLQLLIRQTQTHLRIIHNNPLQLFQIYFLLYYMTQFKNSAFSSNVPDRSKS